MRERVADWLQWLVIVVVLLIDQVLIGVLGHAVMQAWFLVSEKIAMESRRRL